MELIITLIAGAIGGTVAGGLFRTLSLGTIGNSIVGILGGGLAAQALSMLGATAIARLVGGGEIGEIGAIMGPFMAGAFGGAVILLLLGTLRRFLAK